MTFDWAVATACLKSNIRVRHVSWEFGAFIYLYETKLYTEDGLEFSNIQALHLSKIGEWELYSDQIHGLHHIMVVDKTESFREDHCYKNNSN